MKLTEKEKEARKRICLPLDNLNSIKELEDRVNELKEVVGMFKIGLGSYTKFGQEAVKIVNYYGAEVFLDLKLNDIPETVKDAAYAATRLNPYMFSVHTLGGLNSMRAAVDGSMEAYNSYRRPRIIGVTILTSIDIKAMNNELRIKGSVEEQVLHLAKLSNRAGLDGIVCSADNLKNIKESLPSDFVYVTSGIKERTVGADQKRISSAREAIKNGATILVVERSITEHGSAQERINAGYEILKSVAEEI